MATYKIPYGTGKNKHQKEFDEDLTTKFLHLNSGYGGGKTFALVQKGLKLSYLNRPYPGGLVVPSFRDYKRDVLPIMEDVLDQAKLIDKCRYHKTDAYWQFPWTPGKLYVASAETKLRGPNWAYALINEITLMPWERYREAVGRVRIKNTPNPQIASVGTPEGTASDLYEHFVLNPMERSRIIYGDTRDNAANLASDYIKSLMDSYDPIALKAYLMGLFINMNGHQFYYALDPNKNYDDTIVEDATAPVLVTMDFNVDPFCVSLWQRHWNKERDWVEYHAFGEIILQGGHQTEHMARALIERGYTPERTTIFPDPHGKSRSTQGNPDVVTLMHAGFKQIRTANVAPQFRRRQLGVNNLLDKARIKVNPKKCPWLKRDLEAVEQDPVDYSKLKKNPKLTHSSDGMDYMLDLLEPLSGAKPKSGSTRIR